MYRYTVHIQWLRVDPEGKLGSRQLWSSLGGPECSRERYSSLFVIPNAWEHFQSDTERPTARSRLGFPGFSQTRQLWPEAIRGNCYLNPPLVFKRSETRGNLNKRYFFRWFWRSNFRRLRRAWNMFLSNAIILRRRRRKFLGFWMLKSRFLKGKSMQNDVKYWNFRLRRHLTEISESHEGAKQGGNLNKGGDLNNSYPWYC